VLQAISSEYCVHTRHGPDHRAQPLQRFDALREGVLVFGVIPTDTVNVIGFWRSYSYLIAWIWST
jgi:hypothetical protein